MNPRLTTPANGLLQAAIGLGRDAAAEEAAQTPYRPVTATAGATFHSPSTPAPPTPALTSNGSTVSDTQIITPRTSGGHSTSSDRPTYGPLNCRFNEVRAAISELELGQFMNSAEILAKREDFLSALHRAMHIISYTYPFEDDESDDEEATRAAIRQHGPRAVIALHTVEERAQYWIPERVGHAFTAIAFETALFDFVYRALGTELRQFFERAIGLYQPYHLRKRRYFRALSCHLSLWFHERICAFIGCDDLTAMRFLLLLTMKVYAVLVELVVIVIRFRYDRVWRPWDLLG